MGYRVSFRTQPWGGLPKTSIHISLCLAPSAEWMSVSFNNMKGTGNGCMLVFTGGNWQSSPPSSLFLPCSFFFSLPPLDWRDLGTHPRPQWDPQGWKIIPLFLQWQHKYSGDLTDQIDNCYGAISQPSDGFYLTLKKAQWSRNVGVLPNTFLGVYKQSST